MSVEVSSAFCLRLLRVAADRATEGEYLISLVNELIESAAHYAYIIEVCVYRHSAYNSTTKIPQCQPRD